ncbi:MAG: hypothetical protein R3D80_15030 [Paracoccaceae bacterium]
MNPYLVLTAILGGMLFGLENPELPLPLPLDDENGEHADPLTADWATAVDTFEESAIAGDTFGEAFRRIYTAVRRDEIEQLTTAISQIEYRTYLGRL